MNDPCKICADYPHHCRGICIAKSMYINEVEEDTPIIKRPKKRVFDNSINKNGIRRSL